MAEPNNTPMPGATPVPGSTPRAGSPSSPFAPPPSLLANIPAVASSIRSEKPTVLHIGDPVKYHPEIYAKFSSLFHVVRPCAEERQRSAFIQSLRERRWGDFQAVFRPAWGSGGEMGRWDRELVHLLPDSVKVFASAGAGFDWADIQVLGEKGIIYCNAGLAAADAVADFAAAMIISTFRHLPWCIGAASAGSPVKFQACHQDATPQSRNLGNQVLGLLGLGNIGQAVARRMGAGFGMRIHYYDVVRKPTDVEESLGVIFHNTMDGLLAVSDCLVLCTPALSEGGNCGSRLMTAEAIGKMKIGARFVNLARGSLVDEDAVAEALETGQLSAVALDVHTTEPYVSPRLLRLAEKNAMLTCHNAGGTLDTHMGFEELSMRNIIAVLTGGNPITPVNIQYLKT